jgi:hypothetical protein
VVLAPREEGEQDSIRSQDMCLFKVTLNGTPSPAS